MEIYSDDFQEDTIYDLNEDLIYIEDIAEGAFGKVIHVKEKNSNKDISVKIIDKRKADQNLINKMKEEISIIKKLEHENIVKFYGHIETSTQLLIKMEYLKYGTLSQWMKKHKKITEEEASIIIKKVLSAIDYLHSNQICHRDIKPENIMLSKENDLNSIKIIDFGLSAQNFDSLYNSDYCGTFIYMAPEQIERKSYYLSVDIWSIGILMYMLLNKGEHPFYHNGDTKEEFISNLKSIKKLKCKNKISYMGLNLLKKLLEPDPLKRYKANDALKHPWITRNPEDKIPQTINDQLNYDNDINNARELMMISIFLNYCKKNNIYYKDINNREYLGHHIKIDSFDINKFKLKKKKKGIYKINDDYIKKCEYISKVEKEKLKELREKYFDVSSTEEESDEKNNNNSNIVNSNSNFNTNSNSNFSNSNISMVKQYNVTKENKKYKIFSGISNTSREKPVILLTSQKKNLKCYKINNIGFTQQKKESLKIKKGKSLYLKNLGKELNNNYNLTYRPSSNQKGYQNYSRATTKVNINKNINVFNYLNKNINIKPINLFLNNNNNISNNHSKKNNSRTNITNIKFDINNYNNKIDKRHQTSKSSIKLPIINSKNRKKSKISNKLLSLYN